MRVPNEPTGEPGGPFAELLRLQANFQTRLVEDTLRYLRQLQGVLGPLAPGTVVVPNGEVELVGEAQPDGTVSLRLEVENRQRVHCVTTPMLTPLVGSGGATWYPSAEVHPVSLLLAPDDVAEITVDVAVPSVLPSGTYFGGLILQGFRDGSVSVRIVVSNPEEHDGTRGDDAEPVVEPTEQKRSSRAPRPDRRKSSS